MMKSVLARVRFYHTHEGGRLGPTPEAGRLGCIFVFEGENYGGALMLDEVGSIAPGQEARVVIEFLRPELLENRLQVGSRFLLRDYRLIGEGEVEEID